MLTLFLETKVMAVRVANVSNCVTTVGLTGRPESVSAPLRLKLNICVRVYTLLKLSLVYECIITCCASSVDET